MTSAHLRLICHAFYFIRRSWGPKLQNGVEKCVFASCASLEGHESEEDHINPIPTDTPPFSLTSALNVSPSGSEGEVTFSVASGSDMDAGSMYGDISPSIDFQSHAIPESTHQAPVSSFGSFFGSHGEVESGLVSRYSSSALEAIPNTSDSVSLGEQMTSVSGHGSVMEEIVLSDGDSSSGIE